MYRALSDLARRYQFRNKDEVCCYGLTVSQCYALEALFREGPMATSELARRLNLDLSTTTRLVDQLVRKKLALRRTGSQDGRVREILITEPGHRLIARIEEDFSNLLNSAIDDLSPAIQEVIPEALSRIAKALEACDSKSTIFIPVESIRRNKV